MSWQSKSDLSVSWLRLISTARAANAACYGHEIRARASERATSMSTTTLSTTTPSSPTSLATTPSATAPSPRRRRLERLHLHLRVGNYGVFVYDAIFGYDVFFAATTLYVLLDVSGRRRPLRLRLTTSSSTTSATASATYLRCCL